jgi:hypothetical protein
MTREDQIRKVERGFSDLVIFAEDSWSNLAIVAKVRALRAEVVSLYHWQDPVQPAALKKPARKSPHRQPKPPPAPPEPFEPVEIDETTRWG